MLTVSGVPNLIYVTSTFTTRGESKKKLHVPRTGVPRGYVPFRAALYFYHTLFWDKEMRRLTLEKKTINRRLVGWLVGWSINKLGLTPGSTTMWYNNPSSKFTLRRVTQEEKRMEPRVLKLCFRKPPLQYETRVD